MINIEDKKFWNILKGIAILSIVIGHCCEKLVPFVYLYHLAIFFFISGYFYSEEKYGDNPGLNFSQRIKSNWMRYCFFCMATVIVHNVFLKLGMIINTTSYSPIQVLTELVNTAFFINSEGMAGAMWFVPALIVASTLFGIIIYISRKLSNCSQKNKEMFQNIVIIFISIIAGVIGMILSVKNIFTFYHSETSFLVIPFFACAYFARKYIKDISCILKIWIFIPSCLILWYFSYVHFIRIDLSSNTVGNVYLFYFISLIGIYFCLYLAHVFNKCNILGNLFQLMGKYSFEIMALHFVIFKVIDISYAKLTSINDVSVYSVYPYAFRHLAPIYLVLGIGIPTLIFHLKDYLRAKPVKKSKNNS